MGQITHAIEDRIKALCLDMVRMCVDREQDVRIETHVGSSGTSIMIEVFVAHSDFGFAVGRGGNTAEAMRCIINSYCKKMKLSYMLKFHPVDDRR